MNEVSNSFACFRQEASEQSKAWLEMVSKLEKNSALDPKTREIAYIAVLAAVGLISGIPFHVQQAKQLGATRNEIKSAVLLSLPAVGNQTIAALPVALAAFEGAK